MEVVLVITVVAFLALIIASLPQSVSSINKNRHASIARDIAGKQVDYLRKQTYANLANGTTSFSDQNLTGLPQGAALYEVVDCPEEVCTSLENVKKVTVKVEWNESGDLKKVELVTLVGEGGLGQ